MYNRDHARFEAADIDKDGELSLGEFVLFKNPLRDENVKAVVLERALTPVDTDKDGRISMSEFLEDWHQRVSHNTPENHVNLRGRGRKTTILVQNEID